MLTVCPEWLRLFEKKKMQYSSVIKWKAKERIEEYYELLFHSKKKKNSVTCIKNGWKIHRNNSGSVR